MSEDLGSVGEFGLIERLAGRFEQGPGVTLGIGDDTAVVATHGQTLLTVDMLVEGVHFDLAFDPPEDVGHKALACSVSDVAAMGGTPSSAVVAFGAPAGTSTDVAEAIARGLAGCGAEHGVAIAGGDTVSAPVIVLAVTVLGAPPDGGAVLRSGARPGDLLCVTGAVGAAAAGLALLRRGGDAAAAILSRHPTLARAHRRGQARIREGRAAADWGARAMIDVSDGLAADAAHIAVASSAGLSIAAENVPVADGVAEAAALLGVDPGRLALAGGDDYELLVAVHPHDVDLMRDAIAPTSFRVIGRFTDGTERVVVWPDGTTELLGDLGWSHFS